MTYPSVYGLEESRRRLEEATGRAVEAAESFGSGGVFSQSSLLTLRNGYHKIDKNDFIFQQKMTDSKESFL